MNRLLAINFGGLGDEVLFLPTLHTIKTQHPSLSITLLTEPRGKSICDVTTCIDESLTFDIKKKPLKPADYAQLLALLRNGKFDAVLSSGASPLVAMLLFASGIPRRIGYATNLPARILLTNPVPLNRKQHAAAMYHDLVQGLGIQSQAARPQVSVNNTNVARMRDMMRSLATRRVVLHPGTSKLAVQKGIIKTWSPANWAGLIRLLLKQDGLQVVLAGGPDDDQTVVDILDELGDDRGYPNFFLAYGKTASLKDLVALLELADVLICVDSAPMHLGVGLNKPMVALFGPTDPKKLLWAEPHFIAVRDEEAAARIGDADPFAVKRSAASQPQQPFVQIPLDTVFRSAMDLLKSAEARGSSAESHRQ